MDQRHKNLSALPLEFPDSLPDLRVFALVPLLFDSLVYALGRVSLFLWKRPVAIEDIPNPLQEWPYLKLGTLLLHPVTRRLGMLEYLLQRRPVHPRFSQNLPFARFLSQYADSYVRPFLHA